MMHVLTAGLTAALAASSSHTVVRDDGIVAGSTSASAPTWHNRIAGIVRQRCETCHWKGGPGGFEFTSIDDVVGSATMVREAVAGNIMPPWVASPESAPVRHDRSLRPDEKRDLLAWLADGCPVGEPAAPLPPFVPSTGWRIGEPDLVVAVPEPVAIPATGVVDYLKVKAPTGLAESRWVEAMQIQCDHPTICHHVLARVSYPDGGAQEFIDFYLPGSEPTVFEPGRALLLRAGAVIEFDLHYTPDGIPHQEQTKIGFRFAKEPPKERVRSRILDIGGKLLIPAGAPAHEVRYEFEFVADCFIRRMTPHMHLRGKSARVDLVAPDGTVTTPLILPRWHPEWQFTYEFIEPIHIRAGTRLRGTHVFDNSAANPFNPDPKMVVRNGPQIWDEMAGVFVETYAPVDESQSQIATRDERIDPAEAERRRLMRQKRDEWRRRQREKDGGKGDSGTGDGGTEDGGTEDGASDGFRPDDDRQ
jgi:hypothetical protein